MSFEDMIAADPMLNRLAAYTACREYVRLDTACVSTRTVDIYVLCMYVLYVCTIYLHWRNMISVTAKKLLTMKAAPNTTLKRFPIMPLCLCLAT